MKTKFNQNGLDVYKMSRPIELTSEKGFIPVSDISIQSMESILNTKGYSMPELNSTVSSELPNGLTGYSRNSEGFVMIKSKNKFWLVYPDTTQSYAAGYTRKGKYYIDRIYRSDPYMNLGYINSSYYYFLQKILVGILTMVGIATLVEVFAFRLYYKVWILIIVVGLFLSSVYEIKNTKYIKL